MTTAAKPAAIAPATTETYAAAYGRLTAVADKLRAAGATASIDDLVDDLRAAREAYAVCKVRLESIRREVDAEVEAAEATTSA